MSPPVLSVRNLKKTFPGNSLAVDDVSFDLEEGEILGLLGSNGAGKTTTIQMLLSTLTQTAGSIFYFGKNLSTHRSEILKQVVFASTYANLPWALTVWQNLNIIRRLYGLSKEKFNANLDRLLDRFGILDKKHLPVASLSAGQITRLMLVKAFIVEPKIVLLDEPTASLDPDIASEVCSYILEQRNENGVSFLFTSHKMDEVSKACDRTLFLQKGKIIANDTPSALAKSVSGASLHLTSLTHLPQITQIAKDAKIPFTIREPSVSLLLDEKRIAPFLTQLAQNAIQYNAIDIQKPTLEDYFIQLAQENHR